MDRRTDYKTALLIETVIHKATAHPDVPAARELAELGVPFDVTIRVVTRPAERRHALPTFDTYVA